MTTVPQVRLFIDPDGAVPPYAVVRHPEGYWYGLPGSFKTRLSDEDVKDAVPLQPGPAVLVEIRKRGNAFDVDINSKPAARHVASLVAGEFVAQAALQRAGEPVMVIAAESAGVTPLTRPKLAVVPTER